MSEPPSSSLLAVLHSAGQLQCRNYWDIALILLVAWTVVVLPIRAAFAPDYYKDLEINHNLFQQLEVGLLDPRGMFRFSTAPHRGVQGCRCSTLGS